VQIGGGSLRIYRSDVQQQVFDAIGLSKEEAQSKFGYLLDAFEMGAPPHGGIAFGLDRLVRPTFFHPHCHGHTHACSHGLWSGGPNPRSAHVVAMLRDVSAVPLLTARTPHVRHLAVPCEVERCERRQVVHCSHASSLSTNSRGTTLSGGRAGGGGDQIMLIAGESSIRDVIAFPKTSGAQCLLTEAPGAVTDEQLRDLHIRKATEEEVASKVW
jgi:hypothetical protein